MAITADMAGVQLSRTIDNGSMMPSDWIMTIYGACVNPNVKIGSNLVELTGSIPAGAYAQINSLSKTITLTVSRWSESENLRFGSTVTYESGVSERGIEINATDLPVGQWVERSYETTAHYVGMANISIWTGGGNTAHIASMRVEKLAGGGNDGILRLTAPDDDHADLYIQPNAKPTPWEPGHHYYIGMWARCANNVPASIGFTCDAAPWFGVTDVKLTSDWQYFEAYGTVNSDADRQLHIFVDAGSKGAQIECYGVRLYDRYIHPERNLLATDWVGTDGSEYKTI